ncbi:MFS transporter [Ligilactobacillus pobuzihii]|uniref:Mfs family major facilitator transporter n=2 Tax=Ligilactobacillus pobuzihii TaxID=449659 RepID=A0A0R2L1P3_9LACO|nr:MFS transporter [Ligilactobacillus pobuzihii]KRN95586.1 mfs family major facilitator transporter [Ligilactobacillus pobuzihii]GEN47996.1 MFS transporter [Ligilactobacillus pobuzihii]
MRKFRIQSFVLILLAFVLGFSEFIIVGILDDIAQQFSVDISVVGYLVTIFALVYAVSTPIVTSLIKSNLYRALLLLLGIFTFGNLLTAVSPTYSVLVISRVVTAIVSGAAISLAMTFATVIAPLERRAWLVSWIFSGFSIASVFGVPLGTWISTTFGWRETFYTITAFSVLTFILVIRFLPRDLEQAKSSGIRDQFVIFKDPRILLSVAVAMFSLAGVYVFYTYLRPILSQTLNYAPSMITLMLTIYGIMSLFSNQYSGKIADNRGLKAMPTVYVIELLALGAMPLLLNSKIIGTIDVMLVGALMYLINSPVQLHILSVAEHDYPQAMVLASSLNSIFANFGISLGSAVGGIVVSNFGIQNVGFGGSIFTLITLIAVIMLNKTNDKHISE